MNNVVSSGVGGDYCFDCCFKILNESIQTSLEVGFTSTCDLHWLAGKANRFVVLVADASCQSEGQMVRHKKVNGAVGQPAGALNGAPAVPTLAQFAFCGRHWGSRPYWRMTTYRTGLGDTPVWRFRRNIVYWSGQTSNQICQLVLDEVNVTLVFPRCPCRCWRFAKTQFRCTSGYSRRTSSYYLGYIHGQFQPVTCLLQSFLCRQSPSPSLRAYFLTYSSDTSIKNDPSKITPACRRSRP